VFYENVISVVRSSRLESLSRAQKSHDENTLISSGQREAHRLWKFSNSCVQIARQIINYDDNVVLIEARRTLSIPLSNDASNGPRKFTLEKRDRTLFSRE